MMISQTQKRSPKRLKPEEIQKLAEFFEILIGFDRKTNILGKHTHNDKLVNGRTKAENKRGL